MMFNARTGGGILFAAAVFLAGSSEVSAQSNSLYNRQGPVSSQTNSKLSQSSLRGSGASAVGNSSSALGSQAGSLAASKSSNIRRGNFVGLSGNEPFVGVDPNATQGNRNTNGQNARNNANRNNRGRNANRGQRGGNQNFQPFNNNGNRNGNSRNTRRAVRPRQRINFQYPARATTEVVTALRTQFTTLAENYPALAGVTVSAKDGRVELSGEVDSPERRHLAALIARMEPGVSEVVNHLTVRSPSPPSLE